MSALYVHCTMQAHALTLNHNLNNNCLDSYACFTQILTISNNINVLVRMVNSHNMQYGTKLIGELCQSGSHFCLNWLSFHYFCAAHAVLKLP